MGTSDGEGASENGEHMYVWHSESVFSVNKAVGVPRGEKQGIHVLQRTIL